MTELKADNLGSGEQAEKGARADVKRAESQRAADLEALAAAEFSAPVESAPDGQGAAVADDGPDNGQLAGAVVHVLGELVASRAGDHWRLSALEVEAWGRAAGPVLDKYLGRAVMGPEVALVAASLGLLVPRLMASRSAARVVRDQVADQGSAPDRGDKGRGEAAEKRDEPVDAAMLGRFQKLAGVE